jgi:hypothetical protein
MTYRQCQNVLTLPAAHHGQYERLQTRAQEAVTGAGAARKLRVAYHSRCRLLL